ADPDLPCLIGQPANRNPMRLRKVGPLVVTPLDYKKGDTGKPEIPRVKLGNHKEWTGQSETHHLNRPIRVLHVEHGRPHEECQGGWEVGKREPNETPMT